MNDHGWKRYHTVSKWINVCAAYQMYTAAHHDQFQNGYRPFCVCMYTACMAENIGESSYLYYLEETNIIATDNIKLREKS